MAEAQTLRDWQSARQRLAGGMADPSGQRLSAATHPPWWWGTTAEERANGSAEALPLGDLADPVSQAAFLLAPGLQRGVQAVANRPPLPLRSVVGSERGNLGPPPLGMRAGRQEALPESVVREETGELKRLYHGTPRTFPDFEMGPMDPGSLYGPGIYLTENAEVAQGYAGKGMPYGNALKSSAEHAANIRQYRQFARAERATGNVQEAEIWEGMAAREEANQVKITGAEQPNVRPVHADIRRPFDIDATYPLDEVAHLTGRTTLLGKRGGWTGQDVYTALEADLGGRAAASQALQDAGYDGITHLGGGMTSGTPHRVYIAFHPDQVYPSFNVPAPGTLGSIK